MRRAVSVPRRLDRSWTTSLVALCVAVLALGIECWRIGRPSPWRDELATLAVGRRTMPQIWLLSQHIDGAISPYYLLVHLTTNSTTTPARLLSALGVAATAALLVGLARLLRIPLWAGLGAAAVLLISPTTSRYGQEARPYALAMAAATAAGYCLIGALTDRPAAVAVQAPDRFTKARLARLAWWAGYVVAIVALGYLQIVGLLVLLPQAVTVLLIARRRLPYWLAAVLLALACCTPLAILSSRQRAAIAWLPKPTLTRLLHLPYWVFGLPRLAWLFAVLAALGLIYPRLRLAISHRWQTLSPNRPTSPDQPTSAGRPSTASQSSAGRLSAGQRSALALAVPWALLPPLALYVLGSLTPFYSERYLLFCVPGWALLIGVGGSLLPQRIIWPVLAVAVLIALPAQNQVRTTLGHGENTRGAADLIAANKQPGDGAVFNPGDKRILSEAFPRQFSGVPDPLLDQDPAETGSLAGGWVSPQLVTSAVEAHRRIWVVDSPASPTTDRIADQAIGVLTAEYTPLGHWTFAPFQITLYQRRDATGRTTPAIK